MINEAYALNEIISNWLYSPQGDPEDCNYAAAAIAYVLLKEKGLEVEAEEDLLKTLKGENIYKADFSKEPDYLYD